MNGGGRRRMTRGEWRKEEDDERGMEERGG